MKRVGEDPWTYVGGRVPGLARRWVPVLRSAILAVIVALTGATSAVADGPYEPNETAATAAGPITTPAIHAAFETPQDADWYVLFPQGVRQIGILATLDSPCPTKYGQIRIALLDAEGSPYSPLGSLTLGLSYATSTQNTVDRLAFTSQVGHRYLLRVTQSSCTGAAYSIDFAPTGALGTTLLPTAECAQAAGAATQAVRRLAGIHAARRHAHGKRRTSLGVRAQIQQQAVVQAKATQAAVCTRNALTSSGWN